MKTLILALSTMILLISCKENAEPESKVAIKPKTETQEESAAFESEDEVVDGWLKAGVDAKTITNKLGNDYEADEGEMSQVNGMYWQQWMFKDKGIVLLMESETADSPKAVVQVTLVQPSGLKTSRGIGIGSSADAVKKAYANVISMEESSEESIVAGSIYSGVIFSITDDVVSEIFIGASAE